MATPDGMIRRARRALAARRGLAALIGLAAIAGAAADALAQAPAAPPALSDAAKAMLGSWEFSNAERDKTCMISFKLDSAGSGRAIELDKACPGVFPGMKDVAAWMLVKDEALRLVDPRGKVVIEFSEVENGLFESSRAVGALYFLQTAAAATGRDRTPDTMFGDWTFTRGGRPLCQISLLNSSTDAENFDLKLGAACDALITGFSLKGWRMDRGQLVLLSARSDPWRFEEGDSGSWHRLPEGRNPLLLVRQ
jgi:hypothetical protein